MTNTNQRYDITKTLFCGTEFSSVRVDGIDLYPISELVKITEFKFTKNHIQRDIKALLGNDSKFTKVLTNLNPKKVNCIDETQLNDLVGELAFEKRNSKARELMKASFHAMLRAANDSARGQEEEVQYYLELAAMRAEGIKYRRLFTDVVKMQKELGFELNYGYLTILVYRCTELIEKYNAWKVVYPSKQERKGHTFRGTLNQLELIQLNNFELRAAERALAKEIPIIQAIKDTHEFYN